MIVKDQSEGLEVSKKSLQTVIRNDGLVTTSERLIASEHFLDLIINENLAAKLVCTPSNLTEMVVGRMVTEGYIETADEIRMIYICKYASKVKVFLHKEINLEKFTDREPTCCTGNQVILKNSGFRPLEVLETTEWNADQVFKLIGAFASGSAIHKATKGTHSSILTVNGEIVYTCEDIGRHNALDKAIGYAVLHGYDRKQCMLFTTGRVPTDMVQKVVAAKIPVLVSKSVPTDAAVEMAGRYNLTLICNAWPDCFEVYHTGS